MAFEANGSIWLGGILVLFKLLEIMLQVVVLVIF